MLRIASASTSKRLYFSAIAITTSGTALFSSEVYGSSWNTQNYVSCSSQVHRSTKDNNGGLKKVEKEIELIQRLRPIAEASQRALRLVSTVAMIIFEYKIDSYKHHFNSTMKSKGFDKLAISDDNDFKRQTLEREVEQTLVELQQTQQQYAEPEGRKMGKNERTKIQARRRKDVHDAAEKLGKAEQKLSDFMDSQEALKKSTKTADEEMKISSVHARAATRLRDLCRLNAGTYIKVGQHLANLDHLLPPEYIKILHSLFADCPITPIDEVRNVILEELGDYPEHIFDSFEEEPIASASLAQVHIAREKLTGRKLAIKVQHRGLRETSKGDLLALESIVRVIDRVFDEFKWGWIVDEIAPNLPKELDFKHEGRNGERAEKHLKQSGLDCIVPKVHWDHTTERVLCMDFEHGYSVTNIEEIDLQKVNKRNLSSLISSVFQAQIFESGFIHCDPHPENVLWRKTANGKPQLVLLDHGLYKQIDDEFRINYARLWKGLLIADIDQIKDSCTKMGIKDMYPLLSAMLMSRPFDEVIERSKTGSFEAEKQIDNKSDAAMIRGYAQQYLGEIIKLLDKVPRQMLLLFKMNDCLRHIDHALSSNSTTNLVIAGKYAIKATYKNKQSVNVKDWFVYVVAMTRIRLYEVAQWWINIKQHRILI